MYNFNFMCTTQGPVGVPGLNGPQGSPGKQVCMSLHTST